MHWLFNIPFFFFIIGVHHGFCQKSVLKPFVKHKKVMVQSCTFPLDSLSLMPHSVSITIQGHAIQDFSISNSRITLAPEICQKWQSDTMMISYRTFNFDIEKPVFTIDSTILSFKEKYYTSGYEYQPFSSRVGVIDAKGLDYKGSFSRGFSVGNSQSLVLNSNFDMQLVGDLGEGLKVVAAISDENLPIQAQGNTQQLQEFDRVFIQVSKDKSSVTAGDYDLRRPNSYFMNYFKKLKGITLATTVQTSKSTEVFTKASFAISRGKFARQFIKINEGNQGPYRLQGNNGERFIIVLAGTEKVFFNGILMVRGFDYDYTIDYNRAELIFSPTRVVARDSRVIVEFEYTDISYLRSLYATQTTFKGKKWDANFNFYSEQDSKNVTGEIQLDSLDLKILDESGDDLNKTVRKSIRLLNEEDKKQANRILYIGQVDPVDPSGLILIFTENIDSAQYTAVFTELGPGLGDYIIDNTKNKNARVYKYVGKNMGSYLPIVQLIPPEQKQLITVNGSYKWNQNTDVFAELGWSNLDKNRRSSIGNSDNVGLASQVALRHQMRLDSSGNWSLKANLKHEHVQKNFNALNPFRAPEFIRDWNITDLKTLGDENLMTGQIALSRRAGTELTYGFQSFTRANVFEGSKHEVLLISKSNSFSIRALNNWLQTSSTPLQQTTSFMRPNINVQYVLDQKNKWTWAAELDAEFNQIKNVPTDTLQSGSYSYQHYKMMIGNDFSKNLATKLVYSVRNDFFANKNLMQHASIAKELELLGKWTPSSNSDLQWSIIGRQLDVLEQGLLPNDRSKKTVLGKLDYIFSIFNGGIKSTTSYNTSSGQEPKIEYVFQKVETGQGEYLFIGDEKNLNLSNIQDFRYDPTNPLATYIRLSLVNNEFIRTNNIEVNQSLHIEPSKFKSPKEGKKLGRTYRWISKFSTLSNVRITKKQMDDQSASLASFLDFSLSDTSLVAYNALNSNTLFFNRGDVRYDIQLGNRNVQNRIVQVNGFEDRGQNELFLRTRYNFKNKVDVFLILETARKTYESQAFGDRNLDIFISRLKPEISIRPTPNTRINLKYAYQDKNQRILSRDVAYINEWSAALTFRKANTYSIDGTFSFVKIQYSGLPNSPIEFDLLEGLKDGRNYLWNILFTKRMAKNIDLTIDYEGRLTGVSPTVHVARAQVKASF